jgi:hydrogenase expression/formation protein HypC
VIVHVGFALSVVDEAEANQVFEYLRQMDELQELGVGSPPPESSLATGPSG